MRYRAKQLAYGLLALGMILAMAACGQASGSDETKSEAATAQGPAQEVSVAMGDFFYDPSAVTVKAGRVRFALSNVGQTAHRFAITGQGVNTSSKNVGAGREGVLELDLAPGTYKMGCTLGDHEKRGSVGQITVTQ